MTEPDKTQLPDPADDASVSQPTPPAVPDDVAILPAEPDLADEEAELLVVELEVTVLISPAEGQPLEGLARTLIDLAEHPHHVEWRPRQGAFEVPAALAQAYAQAVTPAAEDSKRKTPAARKGSRTAKNSKKEGGSNG